MYVFQSKDFGELISIWIITFIEPNFNFKNCKLDYLRRLKVINEFKSQISHDQTCPFAPPPVITRF